MFSRSVCLGNWQEERVLEEAKVQTFRDRTSQGTSKLSQQQLKLALCNSIVPLTYSKDNVIRFGDTIMLNQLETGVFLACDPFEEINCTVDKFLVTGYASGKKEPQARTTFRIVRPPTNLKHFEDNENDQILRMGQAFCLACNESLLVKENADILAPTLYLCSTKKNERTTTKNTDRQMVYLSNQQDSDSIWLAVKPSYGRANISERYLATRQPLIVGDVIQLTHRQTNMYLTVDPKQVIRTQFGIDYECYADRASSCKKLGLLISEKKGESTGETLTKPDASQFSWTIVTANSEEEAVESRRLPAPATIDVLLNKYREFIVSRGVDAFWNLRAFIIEIEKVNFADGKIEKENLKDALFKWGCPLEFKSLSKIVDMGDNNKIGMIEWRRFISSLRGDVPPSRKKIIKEVFERIDKKREGFVPVTTIQSIFNGRNHPLVAIGGGTNNDALEHFLFSTTLKTSRSKPLAYLTYEPFEDYYADLSIAIEDDDIFTDIINSNFDA